MNARASSPLCRFASQSPRASPNATGHDDDADQQQRQRAPGVREGRSRSRRHRGTPDGTARSRVFPASADPGSSPWAPGAVSRRVAVTPRPTWRSHDHHHCRHDLGAGAHAHADRPAAHRLAARRPAHLPRRRLDVRRPRLGRRHRRGHPRARRHRLRLRRAAGRRAGCLASPGSPPGSCSPGSIGLAGTSPTASRRSTCPWATPSSSTGRAPPT